MISVCGLIITVTENVVHVRSTRAQDTLLYDGRSMDYAARFMASDRKAGQSAGQGHYGDYGSLVLGHGAVAIVQSFLNPLPVRHDTHGAVIKPVEQRDAASRWAEVFLIRAGQHVACMRIAGSGERSVPLPDLGRALGGTRPDTTIRADGSSKRRSLRSRTPPPWP